MFNQDLVRNLCEKIIAETDVPKIKELNELLQAVISEDVEEIELQMDFLIRKYGITFESESESKVIEFPSLER